MKLAIFLGLMLSVSAHATKSGGGILITCKGHIGSTSIDRPLVFGGPNPTSQEFATVDNTTYAIQLASFGGWIDILLLQTARDEHGNILSTGYVRGHGATTLDLVDSARKINLTCDMSGAPPTGTLLLNPHFPPQ